MCSDIENTTSTTTTANNTNNKTPLGCGGIEDSPHVQRIKGIQCFPNKVDGEC